MLDSEAWQARLQKVGSGGFIECWKRRDNIVQVVVQRFGIVGVELCSCAVIFERT